MTKDYNNDAGNIISSIPAINFYWTKKTLKLSV